LKRKKRWFKKLIGYLKLKKERREEINKEPRTRKRKSIDELYDDPKLSDSEYQKLVSLDSISCHLVEVVNKLNSIAETLKNQ